MAKNSKAFLNNIQQIPIEYLYELFHDYCTRPTEANCAVCAKTYVRLMNALSKEMVRQKWR
jgi:hypothetical protein